MNCKRWRCCRISCGALLFSPPVLPNNTAMADPCCHGMLFKFKYFIITVFPKFSKQKHQETLNQLPTANSSSLLIYLFNKMLSSAQQLGHVCYLRSKGNIWICSESCNFRISPTPLIPSRYVVYFRTVLWSIARFLRSSQQVTGTVEMGPRNLKRINAQQTKICEDSFYKTKTNILMDDLKSPN